MVPSSFCWESSSKQHVLTYCVKKEIPCNSSANTVATILKTHIQSYSITLPIKTWHFVVKCGVNDLFYVQKWHIKYVFLVRTRAPNRKKELFWSLGVSSSILKSIIVPLFVSWIQRKFAFFSLHISTDFKILLFNGKTQCFNRWRDDKRISRKNNIWICHFMFFFFILQQVGRGFCLNGPLWHIMCFDELTSALEEVFLTIVCKFNSNIFSLC